MPNTNSVECFLIREQGKAVRKLGSSLYPAGQSGPKANVLGTNTLLLKPIRISVRFRAFSLKSLGLVCNFSPAKTRKPRFLSLFLDLLVCFALPIGKLFTAQI